MLLHGKPVDDCVTSAPVGRGPVQHTSALLHCQCVRPDILLLSEVEHGAVAPRNSQVSSVSTPPLLLHLISLSLHNADMVSFQTIPVTWHVGSNSVHVNGGLKCRILQTWGKAVHVQNLFAILANRTTACLLCSLHLHSIYTLAAVNDLARIAKRCCCVLASLAKRATHDFCLTCAIRGHRTSNITPEVPKMCRHPCTAHR